MVVLHIGELTSAFLKIFAKWNRQKLLRPIYTFRELCGACRAVLMGPLAEVDAYLKEALPIITDIHARGKYAGQGLKTIR